MDAARRRTGRGADDRRDARASHPSGRDAGRGAAGSHRGGHSTSCHERRTPAQTRADHPGGGARGRNLPHRFPGHQPGRPDHRSQGELAIFRSNCTTRAASSCSTRSPRLAITRHARTISPPRPPGRVRSSCGPSCCTQGTPSRLRREPVTWRRPARPKAASNKPALGAERTDPDGERLRLSVLAVSGCWLNCRDPKSSHRSCVRHARGRESNRP